MNVEDDPRMKAAAMAGIAENVSFSRSERAYARGYAAGFDAACRAAGQPGLLDDDDDENGGGGGE